MREVLRGQKATVRYHFEAFLSARQVHPDLQVRRAEFSAPYQEALRQFLQYPDIFRPVLCAAPRRAALRRGFSSGIRVLCSDMFLRKS